ncbi:MAG: DUF2442 domain-containing protein [Pirellulales bacterium]
MPRVQTVRALDDYRLAIRFDDGAEGEIALRDRLFGPVFEPLRDAGVFAKVFVDEYGAIAWPNGADLAPDAIYEQFRGASRVASRA